MCSFKKTFIDKVHLYHEVDDDRITFEDGTLKTIGKTLTNEGLAILKMFFKIIIFKESPFYYSIKWDDPP